MRRLEKKLNAWIIDLLIAGTSIETKNMSPSGKSFFEKIRNFFAKGLDQMSKDLSPAQRRSLKSKTPTP